VVKLLIDTGADINAQGGDYGNALQAASAGGYEQVVKLLLNKGADVNAQGGRFSNALQAASYGGHKQVVKLLLNKGSNINSQGGYYSNALQAASAGGHEQVVKLLIDKGANVNAQGGGFGNALQAASYGGHEQVVKLLLNKGANANVQGGRYGNALCAAIPKGYTTIARMLIKSGADTEMMDRHGWTASMIASKSDHQKLHDALGSNEHGLQWNVSQCLAPTILIKATENSTIKIATDGKTVAAGLYTSLENLSLTLTKILDQVDLNELESRVQVRGNHPFPIDQQIAYFEITIHNAGFNRYLLPFRELLAAYLANSFPIKPV
jgi:ankyrin repeat protein